jgi:class 3 adenylate cyclase
MGLVWHPVRVSAGGPPAGVVTFLFTDVEGSTRRWEADAGAMRKALVAHDEVLCTTIEKHGGYVVKHTGDGVVAAFASPMSAVEAAVAAQQSLELPVRMGLATGEAELRDGDHRVGLTKSLCVNNLHRFSRAASAASSFSVK